MEEHATSHSSCCSIYITRTCELSDEYARTGGFRVLKATGNTAGAGAGARSQLPRIELSVRLSIQLATTVYAPPSSLEFAQVPLKYPSIKDRGL